MLLNTTSKDTWRMIFSYLTVEDISNFKLTSKDFNKKAQEYEELSVRNFYLRIAKDQDFFLCSIYQNTYYVANLTNEINRCHTKDDFELYKRFCIARSQLNNFMSKFVGSEAGKQFMSTINDILLRPALGPVPLKRDCQTCETYSLFQSHLNDALFNLDAESSQLADDSEALNLTSEQQERLKCVKENDKSLILATRWYKTPQLEELSTGDISPLVESYLYLQEVFSSFCRLTSNYLKGIKNPFIFIAEYNTKWNNYVVAMKNIGCYLREYTAIMNEVYGKEYSEYPNYPRFSMWRLMAKLWYEEVFSSLDKKMVESFGLVLNDYINESSYTLQSFIDSKSESIPEDIFSDSSFDVSNAIGEFWNSVLDMGFNEKTIFNLTCTDLNEVQPVSSFCSAIRNLLKEKCDFLLESTNIKHSQKVVIVKEVLETMESLIPHAVFPDIQQTLTEGLRSIIVNFISDADVATPEEAERFIAGESNVKLLKWATSEATECTYPALMKHIQLYRSNKNQHENMLQTREKKLMKNAKSFGMGSCAKQQRFLEFQKTVDVDVLEQHKVIPSC